MRTDLGILATEVLQIYRRRLESRSVDAHLVVEGDVFATVMAVEIKQVVANLLGNAMDATDELGRAGITVRGLASEVVITVSDTGHGIREQDSRRVFKSFFTTRKDVGTGLGLWVSKGIVEKHLGEISFQSCPSPPNRCTTFTVRLKKDI